MFVNRGLDKVVAKPKKVAETKIVGISETVKR
jgi:hypothetical protein